jgi:hypothetical protein
MDLQNDYPIHEDEHAENERENKLENISMHL